jgi:predicted ATPase
MCLDEMQLTDIADAAILTRLITAILSSGARLVATSNRPPSELYQNGLNRHQYIPQFVRTLESHAVRVHEIDGQTDYRQRSATPPGRFCRAGPSATAQLRAAVDAAGAVRSLADCGSIVDLGGGRTLPLEHTRGGACLVSFAALCESPRGAADYLTLARSFHTVAVRDVPIFSPSQHNEARRFITFCDVWYDAGRTLCISAEGALPELFSAMQDSTMSDAAAWHGADPSAATEVRSQGGSSSGWATTFLGDGSEWSATGRLGVSLAALSGLQEAAFAQRRAASRLREMVGG